jgi:hypothetical protein
MFRTTLLLWLCLRAWAQNPDAATPERQAAQLRDLVQQAPQLALKRTELAIQAPAGDWALGMVSSVATDGKGVVYLLQRGDKADPVIAVNREGRVLRSWGKGCIDLLAVWTLSPAASATEARSPHHRGLNRL